MNKNSEDEHVEMAHNKSSESVYDNIQQSPGSDLSEIDHLMHSTPRRRSVRKLSEQLTDIGAIITNTGNVYFLPTTSTENLRILRNNSLGGAEEETKNQILEEKEDEDTRCGVGPFKPSWLQTLASKKTYVLIHGLIGMNMFALGSYFLASISTLEKRFKIPSRTSGLIASAWDMGSLMLLLIFGYLGSRGHKTRYVAFGGFLIGSACFILTIPHLLFGPGQDAIELTEEYGANFSQLTNNTVRDGVSLCGKIAPNYEDCTNKDAISLPAVIFFCAQIILGVGGSMYYTLGMAYLDDNTKKNKAPIYIAISQCIRMLGPTIGFVTASFTLQMYVDPTLHPKINNKDPRWIGAWWVGWAPFGIIAWIWAAIMLLFPRHLPRTAQRKLEQARPTVQRQKSFKDFRFTFGRILKNKVLLFNTFSAVCFMFGKIGYWTFMPKYMETQYGQSASTASLISGSVGLVFTAAGILTSALIISKFKPRPRYLAAWNVMVEIIDTLGHFSWAFLGCNAGNIHGSVQEDNSWSVIAECNSDCGCDSTVKYSPICSVNGSTMFYSACHAGCLSVDMVNDTRTYSNCSCIPSGAAIEGPCAVECGYSFTIFLVIQCAMFFLGASGKAGNTLVQFRCVDEEDKSMSIALSEFALCGLAFIPGPTVYGLLLDSACLVWGQTCGQPGNCWLYDAKGLRYLLNCTAASFLMLATMLDVGVWYHVKDLKIYDDADTQTKEQNNENKKAGVLKKLMSNL